MASRPRTLVLTVLVVAAAFAGCVAAPSVDDVVNDPAPTPALNLTAPTVSASETLGMLKGFSKDFPKRNSDNEFHNAARAFLEANFNTWGLETLQDEFRSPPSPVSTPTGLLTGGRLVNIVGVKWGNVTDEFIVVGAHYDVTDGAVEGAYDDGSGTIIVQKLAEAFANVPTHRTILFVQFDGEEQGLRGSRNMVEAWTNGAWHLDGTIVAMLDFDMVGITWPSEPILVADVPSPEMRDIIDAKREALGMPADRIAYRPIRGGNSDNGPFKSAEIPSVLFISDFDEVTYRGQDYPSSYPFWHQVDTYETMEEMAGGAALLQAGFQTVLDIGSDLLYRLAADPTLTPTFDLSVTGQG